MDKIYTGTTDDDGNKIHVGDVLRSSYGIPPSSVLGKVYQKTNGRFFVATPKHNPRHCSLSNFIKYLGQVWIESPESDPRKGD